MHAVTLKRKASTDAPDSSEQPDQKKKTARNLCAQALKLARIPEHTAEAVKLFQESADLGYVEAQKILAEMYLYGRGGVLKNPSRAAELYRMAAIQGSASSQYNLATMYFEGNGVKQNDQSAMYWLQKVCEQQYPYPSALNKMGTFYQEGTHVEKDPVQAIRLFQLAAKKENANAQFNLGMTYFHGLNGASADWPRAIELFTKAAAQGHAKAQCQMGRMFNQGSGVELDRVQAKRYLEMAASQEDPTARNELAAMHMRGHIDIIGGPNQPMALEHYRRSAFLGDPTGKTQLGALLIS